MEGGDSSKVLRLKKRDDTSTGTRKKGSKRGEGIKPGKGIKGEGCDEIKARLLRVGAGIKRDGVQPKEGKTASPQGGGGSVRLLAWDKVCLLCDKEFKSSAGARLHVQRVCLPKKDEEEVVEAWSKRLKREESADLRDGKGAEHRA